MRPLPLPRKIYDKIIVHPIWAAVFIAVPTIALAVIKQCGHQFGWLTDCGDMKCGTQIVFWTAIGISLGYGTLKSFADKWNHEVKNNGQFVLREMLDGANGVTTKKLRRFAAFIREHMGQSNLNPFREITQPQEQIETILENIQVALGNMTGISRDNIGISVIYKKFDVQDWSWFGVNIGDDSLIQRIIANRNSTFRQLLDGKKKSIFHADKRTAMATRQYVAAPCDGHHKGVGSIICRDISLSDKDVYLQAVLCVTTYGLQLCAERDKETKDLIEDVIMKSFEHRLRLEFSLFFIKKYMASAA